ncbi:MAG: electron transfer flavoprotein-ubiquinone oxidoreductase, partial [Burkholderiales bacterium PBB5]
ENFQLGMELTGKYTVFAEGARGHLGKQLITKYKLDDGRDPASWAIGIKELWEVPADKAQPGLVVHTAGWPVEDGSFAGGFLYHLEGNKVTLGYVVGLDYQNPWSLPKLVFPGGALIGCDAGFLNAARIKGSHAAIKTGMLAAEAIADALASGRSQDELTAYPAAFEKSWLHAELMQTRNFKGWFKKGPTVG